MVVQGAVNPDEFYVFKPVRCAPASGHPAPHAGQQDAEDGVLAARATAGKSTHIEDVSLSADQARFSLSDAEVETLAGYALTIEEHYGRPMDIMG